MEKLKVSTAQFENRSGDKACNLAVIEKLTEKAAAEGSKEIAFHECSITGYTFARKLSKAQMLDLAELIPEGESIINLQEIANKYHMTMLAGLFEKTVKTTCLKRMCVLTKPGWWPNSVN